MSNNINPVLNDIADLAQAYRDACSEADTLLAENQRLSAELAEARKHAKVLTEAMTDDVLEKHPGGDQRQWGNTCSTWLYPDETIVQVRHTDDVKAALKWAKEQP